MKRYIGLFVVMSGAVVLSAVSSPLPASGRWNEGVPSSVGEGRTVLSLADRPSHHGLYRARMIAGADGVEINRFDTWRLEIRTAEGDPVEDAMLKLESWMPDTGWGPGIQPRASGRAGRGHYLIDAVRFDKQGWWNVKVEIQTGAGVDSLAFNLIL